MIYLFSHDYRPDAANLRILSYVKYLSSQGRKATVVFPYPSPERERAEWDLPGISIKYLWSESIRERPWRTINLHLRFRLLLMRIRAGDTVFVYGLPEILPKVIRLRKKGVKIFHERTENPELFRLDGTLGNPAPAEYYSLCGKIDRLLVISRALKEFYASHGVPEEKTDIVNMHVDFSRFEGLAGNCGNSVITYCGSISDNAKDGPDILIQAFSKVLAKHPEARLQLAGSIPPADDANMKLIDRLGIRDKILMPGFVSQNHIPRLLCDSAVLVLPRPESFQATYGFPSKLGEYLASGNPVVASEIGELPLFLEDGKSVVFAVPGDADDLTEKIIRVLDDREQAQEIGRNGRQVARQHFDSRREAAKIFG